MRSSVARPRAARRWAGVPLLAAALAGSVLAAPGSSAAEPVPSRMALDARWGVNGLLDLGPERDRAVDVLLGDGTVFVLRDLLATPGRSSVEARTPDGRRVTGFGTGGRVVLTHATTTARARQLLRTADGGLVVVLEQSTTAGSATVSAVRLDPATDAVDGRWGDRGTVTLPASASFEDAAVDASGRLYLARTSRTGSAARGLVQRVAADGQLDGTFGDGGTVLDPVGSSPHGFSTRARSVVALRDGAAVVGDVGGDGFVARLDESGDPAPDFGTDGRLELGSAGGGRLAGDDDVLYVPRRNGTEELVLQKVDARTADVVLGWAGGGSGRRLDTSPCRPYVHDLSVSGGEVAVLVGTEVCNQQYRTLVQLDERGDLPPELASSPLLDAVRPVSLVAVALDRTTGSAYVTGDPLTTWLSGTPVPPADDAVVARLGAPTPRTGFTPVAPARLLDTRRGIGAPRARVAAGATVVLDVTGVGGVPATGVASVTLNVTAVSPSAGGHVTVHPSGTPRPASSNLNLVAGVTTPAQVVAKVGEDGAVAIFNGGGSVDLLADVSGWTGTSGAGYRAVSPQRLLDTRVGTGAPRGRVPARGEVVLDLGSAVPDGATAVTLNVTAVTPTAQSYVTVYPDGLVRPTTSGLNLRPGVTVPNLVTVPVSPPGRVRLYNDAGSVHLLADLAGYYGADATDDLVPLSPLRIIDTRTNLGAAGTRLGPGGTLRVTVVGRGGVPYGATGAVLNVTGVNPSEETHLTVHPARDVRPVVSNLNLRRGVTQANLVVVRLDDTGQALLTNARGAVDVLVDVAGYYVAEPPPAVP